MSLGWLLRSGFAVALIVVVLLYLARGLGKRFPLVGVLCLVQLLGISIYTISVLIGTPRKLYLQMFWAGDLVAHAAICVLIISLIWQTVGKSKGRERTVFFVAAGLVAFALGSGYTFYSPHLSAWMTPVSRNLSFSEEVLNLILWSLLLKAKGSDYLLLMVSAGIGVQVTGEVIGHTLRLYTGPSTVWVPNNLVYVSEVVCLCIWIWAFRAAATGQVPLPIGDRLRATSQTSSL
jgi:hypothetical protein